MVDTIVSIYSIVVVPLPSCCFDSRNGCRLSCGWRGQTGSASPGVPAMRQSWNSLVWRLISNIFELAWIVHMSVALSRPLVVCLSLSNACAAAHLRGTVEEAESVHFTPGLRWGFREK